MLLDFSNMRISKDEIVEYIKDLKEKYNKMGGWDKFSRGEWLFELIVKSFKNYYEKANLSYFKEKYPGKDADFIVKRLTSIASNYAPRRSYRNFNVCR